LPSFRAPVGAVRTRTTRFTGCTEEVHTYIAGFSDGANWQNACPTECRLVDVEPNFSEVMEPFVIGRVKRRDDRVDKHSRQVIEYVCTKEMTNAGVLL